MPDAASKVGPYVLSEAFAAGATSTVHIGRALHADGRAEVVAIKRLQPHLALSADFRTTFVEEAKLASRIAHPNVVQVFDVIETETDVSIVMEYLRGETLERLLAAGRPPIGIAVAIVREVLSGLHAAHHARGSDGKPLHVVHRDVNPRNIIVTADGVAKVVDFGIARARGRVSMTRDGYTRGTLPYMAPEQVTGQAVTPATDLRAVGVVLWEALTGKRLFVGEHEAAITRRIVDEVVPAPSSVASDIPELLDAVVARALERKPEDRVATALEMAFLLEVATPPASPADVAAWVVATAGAAIDEREAVAPAAAPRRRRRWWILAAAAVTSLGIGLVVVRGGSSPEAARAEPSAEPAPLASVPPASSASVAEPSPMPSAPREKTVVGTRHGSPRPKGTAPASSAKRPPPCVPYFLDDAGHRRFNRDCIQ